jgi:hypothetical protein
MSQADEAVWGGVSAHLFHHDRERDSEHDVAGFISDLDGHIVEGPNWKVAKLSRYIHHPPTGFMNVGQLRPYMVLVATITVVNIEIVAGHTFYASGKDGRSVERNLT